MQPSVIKNAIEYLLNGLEDNAARILHIQLFIHKACGFGIANTHSVMSCSGCSHSAGHVRELSSAIKTYSYVSGYVAIIGHDE